MLVCLAPWLGPRAVQTVFPGFTEQGVARQGGKGTQGGNVEALPAIEKTAAQEIRAPETPAGAEHQLDPAGRASGGYASFHKIRMVGRNLLDLPGDTLVAEVQQVRAQ